MKPVGVVLFAFTLVGCGLIVGDYEFGDAGADHAAPGDDAGDDAAGGDDVGGGDGHANVDGASCNGTIESGTTLCTNVLRTLCTRRVSCCQAAPSPVQSGKTLCNDSDPLGAGTASGNGCRCFGAGGSTCSNQGSTQTCGGSYCGDSCSQAACEMWMPHDPKGASCADAKYANKPVCSDGATKCAADIPSMNCDDLTASPPLWNWPASCTTFWLQF